MNSFQVDTSVKTVVVVGSKPDSDFPLIAPDVVVTAKSSVEQGLVYREKSGSKIIALVPWPELQERGYMKPALVNSQPEELVILGDNEKESILFIENILKLENTKVELQTHNQRNFGLLKNLGRAKYTLMLHMLWIRGFRFFIKTAVYDFFGKRDMQWLSRSTGINGIMYARARFPNATIIVVGIGLVGGGHFDGKGVFTKKSAKSDQIFMKHWPQSKRSNIYTTDDNLSSLGGVDKWKGEIFSN